MIILNHMTIQNLKQSLSAIVISFFCIITLFSLQGCSLIMANATSDMMEHLSSTILNNDDLVMVKEGAPSYLLMIDSLISKDPKNKTLLTTASALYNAYADLFVKDVERSKKMTQKALNYSTRAVCLAKRDACKLRSETFENFEKIISKIKKDDVPALFALGNSWSAWIMANKSDFNAIADIAHIELIMQRVIELDADYKDGAAYLYLGTLATLLPPALGGKPELGKQYFDKALFASKEKNLMIKVIFAKLYAKMIFDRKLHDQLLQEVMASETHVPGYTLINTWAKIQAQELIDSADDYF